MPAIMMIKVRMMMRESIRRASSPSRRSQAFFFGIMAAQKWTRSIRYIFTKSAAMGTIQSRHPMFRRKGVVGRRAHFTSSRYVFDKYGRNTAVSIIIQPNVRAASAYRCVVILTLYGDGGFRVSLLDSALFRSSLSNRTLMAMLLQTPM